MSNITLKKEPWGYSVHIERQKYSQRVEWHYYLLPMLALALAISGMILVVISLAS